MSDHDDGGPAFTAAFPTYSPNHAAQGMSLRDWFAGQALVGILSANPQDGSEDPLKTAATASYLVADAMLAARMVKP